MNSRDRLFAALAGSAATPAAPPGYAGSGTAFEDPVARFVRSLETAGGGVTLVADDASLVDALASSDEVAAAARIFSNLEGIASTLPSDPGLDALADLDLAILRSNGPCVAESGAVWWTPHDLTERRAGLLAQHLVLATPVEALVDDLHSAYERIAPAAAGFGCFLSGPSKTADIEQALVIGAHGPRSLRVFLIGAR